MAKEKSMVKTMRIQSVFDVSPNLGLMLFLMKVSAIAFAYRLLFAAETAAAKFGRKGTSRIAAPVANRFAVVFSSRNRLGSLDIDF